jgi:hypothetical protein
MSVVEIENLIYKTIEHYDKSLFLEKFSEQKVLSKRDVTRRLDMSYNTLMRKIDRGLIKLRPDGKISEKALNDYLKL